MKPLILNSIPAYPEAAVSASILKDQLSTLIASIPADRQEVILLIDERNSELIAEVESAMLDGFRILPVCAARGFVYRNASAVAKVLKDEKPIPSGMEEPIELYTIEEYLDKEHKTIIVDCGNGRQKKLRLERKTDIGRILSGCECPEVKALYFGYPMSTLMGIDKRHSEVVLNTDYIAIIREEDCILDRLTSLIGTYLHECCGRCVFGYEGITQIHTILFDMTQKKGKAGDIDLLIDLCQTMRSQTLCDIGVAAAGFVLSALERYRTEIEDHITKNSCAAGVCRKFVTFHILQDLCSGCGECIEACEDDAILGKKKYVHVIDQGECSQCGSCAAVCSENAIVSAGIVKPKCPQKPIPCR